MYNDRAGLNFCSGAIVLQVRLKYTVETISYKSDSKCCYTQIEEGKQRTEKVSNNFGTFVLSPLKVKQLQ